MSDVNIYLDKKPGKIKPVHGVNNGPVCYGSLTDVSHYFKETGIPYIRLHDCNWPHPREVDIYTIFPDCNKDPDDPASYDFSRTDDYIKSVLDIGAEIIYRLGVSIEHTKKKYYTYPPEDPEKWAKICIGIIRHYNCGWADGFFYGIKYWEIWNEPDTPEFFGFMWSGTREQYFELYKIAAAKIKEFDPGLKVGGYAAHAPKSDFTVQFLAYCRENRTALDFYSWHAYTDQPMSIAENSVYIRNLLDKHGFTTTESHLNEWNYTFNGLGNTPIFKPGNEYSTQEYFERLKSEEGASFDAAVLIALQDCPVDIANYYDAAPASYWSLFNYYGVPEKNFYAFKAFNELWNHSTRLISELNPGINGLYCCGGMNAKENGIVLLISNYAAESRVYTIGLNSLPAESACICKTYVLDRERDMELICTEKADASDMVLKKYINKYSVVLMKVDYD